LGDVISWHASSGVLPNDPSIPSESRFSIVTEGMLSLETGFLHVSDTRTSGGSRKMQIVKTDVDPIQPADSWAYQVQLKMNSHSRPTANWGAEVGIRDVARFPVILIARDRVGFAGYNSDSFIDGRVHRLDTTDGFHTYRVVKDGENVELFVDDFGSAVLTIPYGRMQSSSGTHFRVGTSGKGVANFDVRSFAFNPSGTVIPEPSSLMLLTGGLSALGLVVCRGRRRLRS